MWILKVVLYLWSSVCHDVLCTDSLNICSLEFIFTPLFIVVLFFYKDISVYGFDNLTQVANFLNQPARFQPVVPENKSEEEMSCSLHRVLAMSERDKCNVS